MKRLSLCVAIVASLILFSLYGLHYSDEKSEQILREIHSVGEYSRSGDTNSALKSARNAKKLWLELSDSTVFVESTEADNEIKMSLSRIILLAKSENDDLYTECAVLQGLIEMYVQRQRPTVANIF